jgi:hypothetical protein
MNKERGVIMINYVFSEEIYKKEYGKPKGKGAWTFGDRNKTFVITVGSDEEPLTYEKAKKAACLELEKQRYPMYKTIYLHP